MSELVDEILTAPESEARKTLLAATDEDLTSLVQNGDDAVVDTVLRISDQRLGNRLFALLPRDILRKAMSQAGTTTLGHVISLIRPGLLSELLHQASNEFVERLIESANSAKTRVQIVKSLPPERQHHWKQVIREQEVDIQRTRQLATEGQSSLLEERKRLLDEVNDAIRTKEQVLRSFEDEARIKHDHHSQMLADAQARLASLEDAIAKRQSSLDAREKQLALRLTEFEEANRRQVQQKIEAKVPEFVTAALKVLEDRELNYRRKAAQWTTHGTIVLLVAIAATVGLSIFGYGMTTSIKDISWQAMFFVSFKGLVVLGVLGLWAKHAFTISNAYMHEAIKRSDRAHAITFGKLYLEIYGNTVDRKELLDIFENWNITSESAFSKANPATFEPEVLAKLGDFLKLSERGKSAG